MEAFELTLDFDEYIREPVWIIGPRSYLSDRTVPLLDIIAVPARKFRAERITFVGQIEKSATRDYHSRKYKLFHPWQAREKELGLDGVYYIDLRIFGLENWSHFLNKAVPVAVAVREKLLSLGERDPVFILNETVFPAILEFMEIIGYRFVCTNRSVEAHHVLSEASNLSVIDNLSKKMIMPISPLVYENTTEVPNIFAQKVFINRKPPNRSILNIDVIREELILNGFVEYFMEDLSASEQIAVILRATDIVAIHGAALAPLMFRNERHGPLRMIEIVPPGHVVPFFMNMVDEIPCAYRMVRGVPDTDLMADAFSNVDEPSMSFTKRHSLRQFNLDPTSMRFAIDSLDSRNFPFDEIRAPI